ncbi:predicted protein [Naegleria gruberi]|uniref:Predicted protein n=1 Tax=Naegleria gruberi TaxID=5762 RepID=D2VRI1_NAEGR|nr:uncharacterized protein NAEGRDRAFT_71594 [Naegleria gruberi]EFC40678.1 predicted protein [Naegleria gruberi]|eukprot:XP_002673422.1 predicted protein [Naegleria gruberi strain NEG-M]
MPNYESGELFSAGPVDEKQIPREILYRVQLDTLDTFAFKFSGLVCSLEHNELKNCFQNNQEINYDKDCLKISKDYGDCIYRRHYLAAATASNTRKCNLHYKLYEKCFKLMNLGAKEFNPANVMLTHENCKDLFYGYYLNCLKTGLRIHNGPFDSKM